MHPLAYPWVYPILSYGQNTENSLCTQSDLISQPSGYLKLPGSPGTTYGTQLHPFCAVRAPWMPCMPSPLCLPLSLCLSGCLFEAGCHACHFVSISVSLCLSLHPYLMPCSRSHPGQFLSFPHSEEPAPVCVSVSTCLGPHPTFCLHLISSLTPCTPSTCTV